MYLFNDAVASSVGIMLHGRMWKEAVIGTSHVLPLFVIRIAGNPEIHDVGKMGRCYKGLPLYCSTADVQNVPFIVSLSTWQPYRDIP